MFKGPLLKPSEKRAANGDAPKRNGHSRSLRNVSRYEILKDKIRTWWDDRFKIGEYLKEIKDGKLYLPEYETFEEFSEGEFDIKKAYAYRLIEASDTRLSIGESTIVDSITRPSQATALAAVPVEKRVEVMETVIERGPVTAKAITETAARITRPTPAPRPVPVPKKVEPEKHYDKTGYLIPDSVWEDWQRAEEFQSVLTQITRIKSAVVSGIKDDLIFAEVNNTTVATISNMFGDLKRVLPYSVCTTCQGHQKKKCTLCRGRGFVSQFTYDTCVPMATKQIRERAGKK